MAQRANGMHDPLVVPTSELREVLLEWALQRGYHSGGRSAMGQDPDHQSIHQYLAEHTTIHWKRIERILSVGGSYWVPKNVAYGDADELLIAIGRPDLLGTRVSVIPNPQWSQERWRKHMAEQAGWCED
jgi:hypothetical protein